MVLPSGHAAGGSGFGIHPTTPGIEATEKLYRTDAAGWFFLRLPPARYIVTADYFPPDSRAHFEGQSGEVTVTADEVTEVQIVLSQRA